MLGAGGLACTRPLIASRFTMPLWIAFAASIAAHLVALLIPAWQLPLEEDPPPQMAVRLSPPAPPVAVEKKKAPAPFPHRRAAPAAPARTSSDQTEQALPLAQPMAESAVSESTPNGKTTVGAGEPVFAETSVANEEENLPTRPAPWPLRAALGFAVSRNGFLIGESRHLWETDGHGYRLVVEARTTGLAAWVRPVDLRQESRGIVAGGLQPEEYRVIREGRPREALLFSREEGRIILADGASQPFMASQDLISWFYQLAWLDVARTPTQLVVASGRKLAPYRIEIDAEASLVESEAGAWRARRYRVGEGATGEYTEVWLDEKTRLPVLIRHRDRKGDLYEQRLMTLDHAPAPGSESRPD
ncbi:MAG: DUF3108 domain-containing protein [Rhodocyclaceae bacterium]|nr:DUF3108 domain-containing protein [Rhodocyclaceae bacterium]